MSAIDIQLQSLSPDAEVELFEFRVFPDDPSSTEVYFFHNGTNRLGGSVVFDGDTYARYAVEVSGYDKETTGVIPRVRARFSNTQRLFTALALNFNDMLGAQLLRRRTYVRFLDAVNFPGGVNPTADPTQQLPIDVHYLNRKVHESKDLVDLEFTALTDMEGHYIPRRTMQVNNCQFAYRDSVTCGHTGAPLYTKAGVAMPATADVPPFPDHNQASSYAAGKCVVVSRFYDNTPRRLAISKISVPADTPITSSTHWAYGGCPHTLTYCKLIHGAASELPYGGFPGMGRMPTT